MRVGAAKEIGSISVVLVILASLYVVGFNTGYAQGTDQPMTIPIGSSDDVSAASGSNRFVVWTDKYAGNGDIFFRRSADNGATWKAVVNLSNNPGYSATPMIAVSGSNVYVTWLQFSADSSSEDIFFRRSTDNGATWGAKTKVTTASISCGQAAPQCFLGLKVVASGSNVYVLWHTSYFDGTSTGPGEIYLRRSSDNGATWKSTFNLSSNPGQSFDFSIAISGSNLYVVWTQLNAAGTSSDILFRRSTDGGATWKSKINLSNDPGSSGNARIAVSGLNVHVIWEMGDQMLYKRSTDKGATWPDAAQDLSIPPEPYTESLEPRVAVSGSNVYVAWLANADLEKGESASFFFRRSTDNGLTWKAVVDVGQTSSDSTHSIGVYELVVSGSGVFLIGTVSGHGPSLSRSTDGGATWNSVDISAVFTRPSFEPQLAVSGSTAFIVCTENMSGPGFDIFIARSTNSGATWNSAINLSKNSGTSNMPQIEV